MRVECIESFESYRANRRYGAVEVYPEKGKTYTIRTVSQPPNKTCPFYRLNEIVNVSRNHDDGIAEIQFSSLHFRPVTDISALIKLTKVRELEDA